MTLQVVAPAVSWLLVIVGWAFVRNDNNKREDRREVRSALNTITEAIVALEVKAHEYYASDATDTSTTIQVQIKRDQDALVALCERLKAYSPLFDYEGKLFAFRNALTGGNFEETTRTARPPRDIKYQEVSLAAKELVGTLEAAYIKAYRIKAQNPPSSRT